VSHNIPEILANFELSRSEGIQSILTLINLIPDPAILYNRATQEILTANNPLFLLTNLGENDFVGQSIKALLPNLTDTDPISGHDKHALLRHKKQPLIPVNVRIFSLSKTNDNLLMLFKPEEINLSNKQMVAEQVELLNKLVTLMQTKNDQDIKTTLVHILQKSSMILNADVVTLYKTRGSTPQLVQYLSSDELIASELPKSLANEDLPQHQLPSLWTSTKPALSKLEAFAADHNFKFLTIVPIGQGAKNFGLLVAGGKESNQHSNTLSLAKLIAAYTSGLIKNQISLQNIRNIADKIKQVVKIQNEVIKNLDEGVIILSPDLTIADINPAAETILGYANVEALRQKVDSILIGSDSLASAFLSAQQGIPTLTGGELTLHRRNGKSFPAQVMVSPVMSNDQLIAIITLILDISQQEQSQAANKQLEQRAILGEVTAIFAHEVRNPINAIMLSLQVMEENLADEDENIRWIENMQDECNKLLHLMESVLSFAKPLEYKMTGVDLDFILPQILERWHPRLLRLNISSYYETEVDNPIVEGDLRALEQVFTNLISNSVNAMSEKGGSLGIKISESEQADDHNFYLITLSDSGPGIPDEIKTHMFKPFVTGSLHGTGLGLAITQRIINAHKGKIEVESFTGGTIFKVFLVKKGKVL
jgi:two-component system, NtrC family, sensor histidine kinase AtoS